MPRKHAALSSDPQHLQKRAQLPERQAEGLVADPVENNVEKPSRKATPLTSASGCYRLSVRAHAHPPHTHTHTSE